MNSKQKIGVIGVGYLGRFHAQKYAQLPNAELVGIFDINGKRSKEVADECQTQAFASHSELIQQTDALSIAATTKAHYLLALECLTAGKHVLLEKPMCTTLEEAQHLVAVAKENDCILQIGHIERYNNVVRAIQDKLDNPRLIESVRAAPFNLRAIDVNVAFDLMIHDIDIIRTLIPHAITTVSANGISVLSQYIDIASARIEFANDCVATATASRINPRLVRKMSIYQENGYITLDLSQKNMTQFSMGENEVHPGIPELISKEQFFEQGDALKEQIIDFLHCITHKTKPPVSGEEGCEALAIAIEITKIMRAKKDWRQSKLSQAASLETA